MMAWVLDAFVDQMTSVVADLHRHGIIHRDVHPDNIYVVSSTPKSDILRQAWFGDEGNVLSLRFVLVDCTFAIRLQDAATSSKIAHGPFTSPEQTKGRAGLKSDLYALGATIFYGICGVPPPGYLERAASGRDLTLSRPSCHSSRYFNDYLFGLLSLIPDERPIIPDLPESTVESGYCGFIVLGDAILCVDQFASESFPIDIDNIPRSGLPLAILHKYRYLERVDNEPRGFGDEERARIEGELRAALKHRDTIMRRKLLGRRS